MTRTSLSNDAVMLMIDNFAAVLLGLIKDYVADQ